MKPETNLEVSRVAVGNPVPAADRTASRRWALLVAAGGLALGCAAASAGSDWEADWPASADQSRAAASGTSALSATTEAAVQEPERWLDLDLSDEAIAPLRQAAQVGDVNAALAVTARLIDRYEHGKTTEDLFEAVIWIDRYHGAESFANSGLLARVQQRDCRHKVMRLHWLCDEAE